MICCLYDIQVLIYTNMAFRFRFGASKIRSAFSGTITISNECAMLFERIINLIITSNLDIHCASIKPVIFDVKCLNRKFE